MKVTQKLDRFCHEERIKIPAGQREKLVEGSLKHLSPVKLSLYSTSNFEKDCKNLTFSESNMKVFLILPVRQVFKKTVYVLSKVNLPVLNITFNKR